MCVSTLEPMVLALDPLNTPVMEKVPVKVFHFPRKAGTSPPSSGLVRGSMPVIKQLVGMDTSMESTRLVLATVLASLLQHMEAQSMESAKLVLLILPASTQLMMVHQFIPVSRTVSVCVTHVPVRLMTQVSLTSVVTN